MRGSKLKPAKVPVKRSFLNAVRLEREAVQSFDEYPFCIPAIRHLHRLVYHQSQIIIATHSPILLAYPNARIYQFTANGISEIKYTDTEHY